MSQERSFVESSLARDNARAESFSEAHKTQLVAYAAAEKTYAVAVTTAEKQYRLALVEQASSLAQLENDYYYDYYYDDEEDAYGGSAYDTKQVSLAEAQLTRTTAEANADQAWIEQHAAANATYANGQSSAMKTLVDALAGIAATFQQGFVEKSNALDAAYTAAANTFGSALTGLANTLHSAVTSATADLSSAEYTAQESATGEVDSSLDIPWSESLSGVASTVSDWWTSAKTTVLDHATSLAAKETEYQTTVNTAATEATTALGSANTDHASTTTTAEVTHTESLSGAENTFITSLTGPSQQYIQAAAQAERNYRIAVATAERNQTVGQRADGTEYTEDDYDSAVESAAATRDAALKTARETYATAHAAAAGTRLTTIATANQTYASEVAAADVQYTGEVTSAQITHQKSEVDAYSDRLTGITELETTHHSTLAAGKATSLTNYATTSGLPWAGLIADKGSALAEKVSQSFSELSSYVSSVIESHRTEAHTELDAAQTRTDGELSAAETKLNEQAEAAVTAANEQSDSLTDLASTGAHKPSLPSVPGAPSVSLPDIAALSESDYFANLPETYDAAFDSFVDNLLAPQSANERWYHLQPSQLSGEYLNERLVREQIKPDEILYAPTLNEMGAAIWEGVTTFTQPLVDTFDTTISQLQTSVVEPFTQFDDAGPEVTQSTNGIGQQVISRMNPDGSFVASIIPVVGDAPGAESCAASQNGDECELRALDRQDPFEWLWGDTSVMDSVPKDLVDYLLHGKKLKPKAPTVQVEEYLNSLLHYVNVRGETGLSSTEADEALIEFYRLIKWQFSSHVGDANALENESFLRFRRVLGTPVSHADFVEFETVLVARAVRDWFKSHPDDFVRLKKLLLFMVDPPDLTPRNPSEETYVGPPVEMTARERQRVATIYENNLIQWAFQDAQVGNPKAEKIKARVRRNAGHFFPIGVNAPRKDTQDVLKVFSLIPGFGVVPASMDAGIHLYHKEYVEAAFSGVPVIINGASLAVRTRSLRIAPNSAGSRVIGRTDDLAQPGALRTGERTLDMHIERWPDGTINKWATWRNNLEALQDAMAKGKRIRDLSPGDLGGQFLNLERRFLDMKGWRFDKASGLWNPPLP